MSFNNIINNFLNNFNNKSNNQPNLEDLKIQRAWEYKARVFDHLSYSELLLIAKEYISKNPKVIEINSQGQEISREPTRDELKEALFEKVPLKEVQRLIPRTKNIA